MTSMLFVHVESIWNCTSYSFENDDDDDEKENIVQSGLQLEMFSNWLLESSRTQSNVWSNSTSSYDKVELIDT